MITKSREQRLAVHAAEQPTANPTHGGTAASQPLNKPSADSSN